MSNDTTGALTDKEREALGDVWDAETTDSVAAFYPVVEEIIRQREAAALRRPLDRTNTESEK